MVMTRARFYLTKMLLVLLQAILPDILQLALSVMPLVFTVV